jgi:hypothetical protein
MQIITILMIGKIFKNPYYNISHNTKQKFLMRILLIHKRRLRIEIEPIKDDGILQQNIYYSIPQFEKSVNSIPNSLSNFLILLA